MTTDIRPGDWRDHGAIACQSLICDPPFSARTHAGFRSMADTEIDYRPIMPTDAIDIARAWAPLVERWVVIFGDHISSAWHRDAWLAEGWYVFAPVVWARRDAPPRMCGDGPTSSCEYITIARRKGLGPDGSRPGHYVVVSPRDGFRGQKSLDGMRAIVRDYSRPGDLICDPYSGSGTTLVAADIEGRSAIGWERDAETFARAKKRIEMPRTAEMFGGVQ